MDTKVRKEDLVELYRIIVREMIMTQGLTKDSAPSESDQANSPHGYQTAWFLCHRIREAMKTDQSKKLSGTVEVDETYMGGKYDRRRHRAPWEKQPVTGMIERDGKFEAQTIPTNSKNILVELIRERTVPF